MQRRNGPPAFDGPLDSDTASLLAELDAQQAASLSAEGFAAAGASGSAGGAFHEDGLDRYLSKLAPPLATRAAGAGGPAADPSFPSDSGGVASAATAGVVDVLSPAPTLLPSLAFHDLVFGRDLGSGTFSTVRYAKQIVRGTLGSTWPEYAVKVISTSVMQGLGYESAVRREIALLTIMTHPNVARLVSAFRWRDGAYLVLEYAPKGDLHTLLSRLGSLAEHAARFLVAEVVAAMARVHAAGFAYADCKPENILLVEDAAGGSHAKLADFGAARPIDDAGRALVARSRHILKKLRDGDWRAARGLHVSAKDTGVAAAATLAESAASAPRTAVDSASGARCSTGTQHAGQSADAAQGAAKASVEADENEEESAEEEEEEEEEALDERVEGTEEYLSPELADRTGVPSVASDAYALGVTLFQVLCGRMPDAEAMWTEGGAGPAACEDTLHGGATAALTAVDAPHRHVRFQRPPADPFPEGFPAGAQGLVRSLLHPNPTLRLGGGPRGFAEIAEHPWFAPLAARPSLAVGEAGVGGEVALAAAAASQACSAIECLSRLFTAVGPKIAAGAAAPTAADSAWTRRHNSTIWAPLPPSYLRDAEVDAAGGGEPKQGGSAAGRRRVRPASGYTLRELLQLQVLPPLEPAVCTSTSLS
jgi:serine/threonine protein kinase